MINNKQRKARLKAAKTKKPTKTTRKKQNYVSNSTTRGKLLRLWYAPAATPPARSMLGVKMQTQPKKKLNLYCVENEKCINNTRKFKYA